MLSKIINEVSKINVHIIKVRQEDPDDSDSYGFVKYEIFFNKHKDLKDYEGKLQEMGKEFIKNVDSNIIKKEKDRYDYLLRLHVDVDKLYSFYYKKGDLLFHSWITKYLNEIWETHDTPYNGNIGNPEISVFLNYQKAFLDKISIHLNRLIKDLEESNPTLIKEQKLTWLSTPSLFGHIFFQLGKKGFIEIPKRENGKYNFAKYAAICFTCFNIDTTIGALPKELNPNSNSFVQYNEDIFKIPLEKDVNRRSKQ